MSIWRKKIGETPEKIKDAKIAAEIYAVMPIDEQLTLMNERSTLEVVEQDDLIEVIKSVLQTFNEREQIIIQLYYFEELSLKEISETLSITESRISQIHKAVLIKIREKLSHKQVDMEDNG